MPSYDKTPPAISISEGNEFSVTFSGQLDGYNELPTTAANVLVTFSIVVNNETFKITKPLSQFGLTGQQKSNLRTAADLIKDDAIVSDFGFTKT